MDHLNKEDAERTGLMQCEKVNKIVKLKQIPDLQPSDIDQLMDYMDKERHGFIVIPNFMEKIMELASETDAEVRLRRFAKMIGN